jgi:putative flippase GtrA
MGVVSVTRQVRDLYASFRGLIHELAKFGIVGAFNLALDVAIYNALLFTVLEQRTLTARAISTTVAATSSYFMNRHWTWRDQDRTGLHRELPMFLLLSAVGLGLSLACLAVSHYWLGYTSKLADNISSYVFGVPLGMLWRFWSFKRWVFTDPQGYEATPLEAAIRTAE